MGHEESTHPKSVSERHRALMRELIAGATNKEAAARCNFTPMRVSQLRQSELFISEMEKLRGKVETVFAKDVGTDHIQHIREKLDGEIENSIDTLIKLRDGGESESVRAKTCVELLDRAGLKPPTVVQAQVLNLDVNEGLAMMLQGLREVVMGAQEKGLTLEEARREDYNQRHQLLEGVSG